MTTVGKDNKIWNYYERHNNWFKIGSAEFLKFSKYDYFSLSFSERLWIYRVLIWELEQTGFVYEQAI